MSDLIKDVKKLLDNHLNKAETEKEEIKKEVSIYFNSLDDKQNAYEKIIKKFRYSLDSFVERYDFPVINIANSKGNNLLSDFETPKKLKTKIDDLQEYLHSFNHSQEQ